MSELHHENHNHHHEIKFCGYCGCEREKKHHEGCVGKEQELSPKEYTKSIPSTNPPKRNEADPRWKRRRRIIVLSLLFCAFIIAYIIVYCPDKDNRVNEMAIIMSFATGGGIVGSYVFGASYESIKMNGFGVKK